MSNWEAVTVKSPLRDTINVFHVKCQRGGGLESLSSNPHMPRPFNWDDLAPSLTRGQNIPAFLPLTSIFHTENSLDKQFGSAS